jgi:hypothetical protein
MSVRFFAPVKTHLSLFPAIPGLMLAFSLAGAEAVKDTDAVPARVPFPKDYQTTFHKIRVANQPSSSELGTIYANDPAASIGELGQLPYPDGSVFVMEFSEPLKDGKGGLLTDADGTWKKGTVRRVAVMRREKGFGAMYGDKRAGEWEFVTYRPDGILLPLESGAACAACHARAPDRDFVFRGRFPAVGDR